MEIVTSSTELENLTCDVSRLSTCLCNLATQLRQLSTQVESLLNSGCEIEYTDEGVKLRPADGADLKDFEGVLLKCHYDESQKSLIDVLHLRQALLDAFATLSQAVAAKLPTKIGSPWRAYYLQECLDVIPVWPARVESKNPFLEPELNIPDLVRVMKSRPSGPGFPMDERFMSFSVLLDDAVRELRALRLDIAPAGATEQQLTPVAITGGGSPNDGSSTQNEKKSKPDGKTVNVIREIEKGHDNDRVFEILKEQGKEESIENIRQIRSRYERGRYEL